jgi:hypothetical protein
VPSEPESCTDDRQAECTRRLGLPNIECEEWDRGAADTLGGGEVQRVEGSHACH